MIAHEFGHEEYWQTTAKQNVLSWWSGLSSQDKQNYATNTSQLTSAINAQLSSAAFKTASETFAVSCETNAVNCIDTTKDWSEGGANY
ncbi:MAG: hypothetical protein JXR40_08300 [Pontiellaceae bacterium]|nr:hypothetical protein [Pontiellaceae bacterium]